MKIYARMSSVPCYKTLPEWNNNRWPVTLLCLMTAGGAWLMCSVLHAEAHKQWALWLIGHLPNWICETMSAIWLVAVRSRRRHWHKACKTWSTATCRDVDNAGAITHFTNHRTKTLPCQTCFRPEMQPLLKNCLCQHQLQINSTGKNMKLKFYESIISQENR